MVMHLLVLLPRQCSEIFKSGTAQPKGAKGPSLSRLEQLRCRLRESFFLLSASTQHRSPGCVSLRPTLGPGAPWLENALARDEPKLHPIWGFDF
mmetsp:Transcript_37305/g.93636  ORF Transcript_37305/g.93636 Transcript_37305/m.93636 type:complete len:94 (-) Transcript_37305:43-324(-)